MWLKAALLRKLEDRNQERGVDTAVGTKPRLDFPMGPHLEPLQPRRDQDLISEERPAVSPRHGGWEV